MLSEREVMPPTTADSSRLLGGGGHSSGRMLMSTAGGGDAPRYARPQLLLTYLLYRSFCSHRLLGALPHSQPMRALRTTLYRPTYGSTLGLLSLCRPVLLVHTIYLDRSACGPRHRVRARLRLHLGGPPRCGARRGGGALGGARDGKARHVQALPRAHAAGLLDFR